MEGRKATALSIVKGLLVSILVTLLGMALLAGIVIMTEVSDAALLALNQVLKVLAIFFGVVAAVGLGGRRGFLMGAAVGLLYMVLGYALYCILDRQLASPVLLASEFALGAVVGALSGAVVANLKPMGRGKRRVKAKASC